MLATENALELTTSQRKRTVWRLDGGAGKDEHIRWLLARDYHLFAKGMSNRRAGALAEKVQRWDAYGDIWVGEVASLVDYGRAVRVFVKRRLNKGEFHHSYYVSTLSLSSKGHFLACYNGRGGAKGENVVLRLSRVSSYLQTWRIICWPTFITRHWLALGLKAMV